MDSSAILRVDMRFDKRDYIMDPTQVIIQDPCPPGLPETLSVVHTYIYIYLFIYMPLSLSVSVHIYIYIVVS